MDNFLLQAHLIQEQNGHSGSAGALLYEAAKQCINAVANQLGSNPASTGAKVRFVHNLVESGTLDNSLLDGWQGAAHLHINSDRGHLTELGFNTYWEMVEAFIGRMQAFYAANE